MPIKRRHNIHSLGAVTDGSPSPAVDTSDGTSLIVMFDPGAVASVVTPQFSPDGSLNFFDVYNQDDTAFTFAVPGVANFCYFMPIIGEWFRYIPVGEDMSASYVDVMREIS